MTLKPIVNKTADDLYRAVVAAPPVGDDKPAGYHEGWEVGWTAAKAQNDLTWSRLEIAKHVLAGMVSSGRNGTGPDLAALAWQYAGWLLDEAGK